MSNIADPLIMIIMFMVLCFVLVVGVSIIAMFGTDILPANIAAQGQGFFTALNMFGLFIMVAIIIGTIGSAFLIRTNPLFFGVALVLLFVQAIILPLLIAVFNSLYQGFSTGAAQMDSMIWLIQVSPVISIVGGAIAAIVSLRGE